MLADFAVHQSDKEDGGISNPHFHVMCPIRSIEPDSSWGNKQLREYVLDEHGERVLDEAGNYVFNAVPTTGWGKPETLEAWRQAWADLCNSKFAEKGLDCRIDIAALPVRAWSRSPPSTRVPPSGRWSEGHPHRQGQSHPFHLENQRAAAGSQRENCCADRLAKGSESRACQATAAHAQRSAGAALQHPQQERIQQ